MMNTDSYSDHVLLDSYALTLPETSADRKIATGWLLLAVASLLVAGLFSVLIIFSRLPYFQDFILRGDFFHTALAVHVDLTVLVWFLSCAGMLWTLNSRPVGTVYGWLALILATSGAVILIASSFSGEADPLVNHYLSVIQNGIFFTGLGLFAAGFVLLVSRGLFYSRSVGLTISGDGAVRFGLYTALIAATVSIIIFIMTWASIPAIKNNEYFYELLFWGAGHSLKYVYVQLMLVGWLCLATLAGIRLELTPRVVIVLLVIGLFPVLGMPFVYLFYDLSSNQHAQLITMIMQYGGRIAAFPLGLIMAYALIVAIKNNLRETVSANVLMFSVLLFVTAGFSGLLIDSSNLSVPAHYHGLFGAITLVFMGIIYQLLPRLGFMQPQGKMLALQPVVYGVGQFIHVTGLAWSGGYTEQIKTAVSEQGIFMIEKAAGTALMGFGGLIEAAGGVMFILIVVKSVWPARS